MGNKKKALCPGLSGARSYVRLGSSARGTSPPHAQAEVHLGTEELLEVDAILPKRAPRIGRGTHTNIATSIIVKNAAALK